MAIDLCSETSPPRISFSHGVGQTDLVPPADQHYKARLDSLLLDSNSDFDFGVTDSFGHEPSSADELFSNGLILPTQIKHKKSIMAPKQISDHKPIPHPSTAGNSLKESFKEIPVATSEPDEEKPQSKSFWNFKRSSSVNSDTGNYKRSLICSLPLLLRSNSTGSVPNPKRKQQQSSHKALPSIPMPKPTSSSSSTSTSFYTYPLSQKHSSKKSYGGGYNGQGTVRISPVLNMQPPYISKGTANLFGLGSFFGNGKDKKNRK